MNNFCARLASKGPLLVVLFCLAALHLLTSKEKYSAELIEPWIKFITASQTDSPCPERKNTVPLW